MTILVTGATGTIGSRVIAELAGHDVRIRAMTRSPDKAAFPTGVDVVAGDLADIDSVRAALAGVDTLFLLAPNAADELTQVMLTLNAAQEGRIKGIVYLSAFKSEDYANVPHFIGKATVERMIQAYDLPVTVLRPAYFIQNDLRQKDALLGAGVYGMPVGAKGISMVDIRDIGEAAAAELLRRERAPGALPRETYDLVGPDALSGADLAKIWSGALDRPVAYAGDALDGMEQGLKAFAPAWYVYDLVLMMRRYQSEGAVATPADVARFTALLGHPPRSYAAFAREMARDWQA
jgi:uncharacterized protein YbjT (DUF2867 family)